MSGSIGRLSATVLVCQLRASSFVDRQCATEAEGALANHKR